MTLDAIAHALPSVRHSAADIAAQTGADEAFITDKIGIRQRFILAPGESGIDLAEKACRALFKAQSLDPAAIDLLVYVTQNPDRRIPHNSAGLATRLGLPTKLIAFDLSLACSGYVYGLSIVEAMLASLALETAVLVTCDPYSRIMASEDKATNAVFGDAATASLLTRNGKGGRLGKIDFGTDGKGGDAISIAAGGAALPLVALGVDSVNSYDRAALALTMKGRDVFNFVMSRVPESIKACLDANDVTLDEVDLFALHQGSSYMLQTAAQRAGIPADKLLSNIADYGNTVSSSIPLLLEPLINEGGLSGKRVLISGFGAGLSWATALLTF
jgi:3-oxoacyl-[acyl-carrier-protein] synthase III